jgi:ssDNA-binding Zn-finger/Zn-ribbon topoisomerase 1
MSAWRFRRCPKCHEVRAASKFALVDLGGPRWGYQGPAIRACPACGFEAATFEFQVVRERHPDRSEVPA